VKIVCVIKLSDGGHWLVRQARAMLARGHAVTVLLPDPTGALGTALVELGVTVRAAPVTISPATLPKLPLNALRLRRLICDERADVVFYQLWVSAVLTRVATLRLNMPRVHMVPGPAFLAQPIVRRIERFLVRLDDCVVGGSEFTSLEYQRLGVPRRRIVTLAYGADLRYMPGSSIYARRAWRSRMGIPRDAFVVVMVAYVYGGKRLLFGRRPIKGHETLLSAWGAFTSCGRPKRLLLVGSGFDSAGESHRRALVAAFGIGAHDEISWIPTVADVRPYYAVADVSVTPSLTENHGGAVEASAMGVPSIVSDAGGLPEVVATSGWVFRAGDWWALASRLSEVAALPRRELRRRGRAARRYAELHFDADRHAEELVAVLERVVRR
jgi:glycosyltransferase involved in cell wall biosynthesis